MGTRATGPFTVLIGESGVGKSTVGHRLASKLNGTRLCRDDFDYGWRDVYFVLDFTETAVVECVRIPRALRERMEDRGAVLVELVLDNQTRRERLEQREVDEDDIDMLFRIRPGPNAYDTHVEPDLVVNTDQNPDAIADQIAKRVRKVSIGSL
jgi:predicted kinase